MSEIPSTPPTAQGPLVTVTNDEQHLKLLSVFYYVFAGLNALGVCVGTLYLLVGGAMVAAVPAGGAGPNDPPEGMGLIVGGLGLLVLVLSVVMGVLFFFAGQNLRFNRRRVYCMVIAGIACLNVPLGTILGVFTFVVLARPSVKARFERSVYETARR